MNISIILIISYCYLAFVALTRQPFLFSFLLLMCVNLDGVDGLWLHITVCLF
ncbi:hypothetical protein BVRB_7g157560 [Beta vulgaris subsp. vulgaris]|nr:hypothetical protein BVRB_7g157560 [Beta vulgaris subsp. vulgaris]